MKKSVGLDVIRTLAIIFVLSVHFFLNTNFYETPLVDTNIILQVVLRWTFIICVPLFLLLTGYLQTEKKLDGNYFKKIITLLGVYLFYSVLSILIRKYYFKEEKHIIQWIYDILAFSADSYSWYINMYLGLFLMVPFLNMILKSFKSPKEHRYFLIVMIFITGMPGFFNILPPIFGKIKVLFPDWWLSLYPITYYFLGAYIREYQVKISKLLSGTLLTITILIETFLTVYFSWGKTFQNTVGDYGSILIMIEAVLFFLIFYDINIKNKFIIGFSSLISVLTLDIYLCSFVSDKLVYKYVMANIFKSQQQILSYFVLIVMATFTLSSIVSFFRFQISKYLNLRMTKLKAHISNNTYKRLSVILTVAMIASLLLVIANAATGISAVTLSASTTTPTAGDSVTLTSNATGSSSTTKYAFWTDIQGQWKQVSSYSTTNIYVLNNMQPGTYVFVVYALDGFNAPVQSNRVYIKVGSTASVTATYANGQITATATSTNIFNPLYDWWYQNPSGNWIPLNGHFTHSSTVTIPTSATGTYNVVCNVTDPEFFWSLTSNDGQWGSALFAHTTATINVNSYEN